MLPNEEKSNINTYQNTCYERRDMGENSSRKSSSSLYVRSLPKFDLDTKTCISKNVKMALKQRKWVEYEIDLPL